MVPKELQHMGFVTPRAFVLELEVPQLFARLVTS